MKRFLISILLITTVILLSGCSTNEEVLHVAFVDPFTNLIDWLAVKLSGSFGLAIVAITVIIRLILLPLMVKQQKEQRKLQEKMKVLKPELEKIQKEMKTEKDKGRQQALQKDMMSLYQKHGVNPLGVGCLPLIIQTPILMGFYFAIKNSEKIASHSFLWFNLGSPDILLAVLAGAVYFFQFKIQQSLSPVNQQKANKSMQLVGYLSPLMILTFSLSAPSALPVYWSVSGLFLILQTIIVKKI
ncbi:membrane protein insertase YidC [Pseudalkalibacillus caeni]|uniref:Membrane protein insertase YidC n=1 Tax=Exobacillus caeni TaxID=2574798 RepID=A0A5R9F4R7_9BACL|nr:membrane protein insertase YidC [Pseudalkalibacillus caeni]TLS38712.1 membrane protein insertase YidC [Pseudalkalibacillus caeni]